jgi:8-oxo-dGTP pyrophosphatase MutT (NUDIX family)
MYSFQIIFSDQPLPKSIQKSIFLAGPSPRHKNIHDWKKDALTIFEKLRYDGTIFLPVPKNKFYGSDDDKNWTYDNQISWECKARSLADLILFWIPRDIEHGMPGFTTNIEFGEDLHSGKILYGRPNNAEKCRYLDYRILETQTTIYTDLESIIQQAISLLGEGALRKNGEVYVPLFIWQTEQFQLWYTNLKNNGNELIEAKLLHFFKISEQVFSFILLTKIWITKEKRLKSNEFIFSRKDISAVIPYFQKNSETFFVFVKEFRSSVRNIQGMVYELPSGSSFQSNISPLSTIHHEFLEEVGIDISDLQRFQFMTTKQLCSTLSTHCCHLFKLELHSDEFLQIQKSIQEKKSFGVSEDTENISLEIISLKDISQYPIDFSILGMIFSQFQH